MKQQIERNQNVFLVVGSQNPDRRSGFRSQSGQFVSEFD
jgi:hypothetical protein